MGVGSFLPPFYAIEALPAGEFRQAAAVERAVDFLLRLQPEGAYILSRAGDDDVVPMDVAHAVIALVKAGQLAPARAALDWLLARQTRPDDPGAVETKELDGGEWATVDYAGSWYDHYRPDGSARTELTRGRGEGAGLALLAVAALAQEDPAYPGRLVAGEPVLAYVARAARYLASPAVQRPDGRFGHRPDYRVSFAEEAARMALGLRSAAELLAAGGAVEEAATARAASERGLAPLHTGDGLVRGMAYDYFARALWGLAAGDDARAELAATRGSGLVRPDGLRHYDWQMRRARRPVARLIWWIRGRVLAPAESFDWGIALLAAGDLIAALTLEAAWLQRQRRDGGFAGGYLDLAGLRLPVGAPASYAVARFILFERLLTAAAHPRTARSAGARRAALGH